MSLASVVRHDFYQCICSESSFSWNKTRVLISTGVKAYSFMKCLENDSTRWIWQKNIKRLGKGKRVLGDHMQGKENVREIISGNDVVQ